MIKFPKEFLFGVSLSGPQTEGNENKANENVMDYWYKISPHDFHDQIGPNKTCQFYSNYKQHLKWLDFMKIECYRTSIQWSRLIKDIENNTICNDGYNFYLNYFKEIKKYNLKLIVNLHHFDLPLYLFKKGGWTNKETIYKYFEYAKKCFELFGDIVDEWATFNEPMAEVDCKYLYGWHYPKIKDFKTSIQVYYNMILAHSIVTNFFKENYKNKKISIIVNVTPVYSRSNNECDLEAKEFKNMLIVYSQLDLLINHSYSNDLYKFLKKYNLLPESNEQEKKIIKKGKIDYLSINYYQPFRVMKKESKKNNFDVYPTDFYDIYDWPKKKVNPYRGWEIYPQGIYDIAMLIKEKYNNFPWMISENGMGVENEEIFRNKDNIINDQYRIDFIEEHLQWLKKALDQNANCLGYNLWTFIDCWSWANAYKNRYGLIEYNLTNNTSNYKSSALYFKQLIQLKNK